MTAPVRIEAISRFGILLSWEWYVGLTYLDKPVELVVMPGGAHELIRPTERYFSLQGNVDWFDYWLNGHEDPDPAKVEQYRRWRELKVKQQRSLAAH